MDRKEMKRTRMDELSQKFADTELAFEYELGVEYQRKLMQRHEQLKKKQDQQKETPHQK